MAQDVRFTKIDFKALVEEINKNEPPQKDVAYKFSKGREFLRPKILYQTGE